MSLLHVEYARSVCFSEPPKIKDVAVHPYLEIKVKKFLLKSTILFQKTE